MQRLSPVLRPVALLFLLLAGMPAAHAADPVNLFIMGEDADPDAVPRNSRVFNRTFRAMERQLQNGGFRVFDETAATPGFRQGRVRRSPEEMIDIARSVRNPPIDVVVFFTIYASANETGYNTKLRTRVEGRMLNVRNSESLGSIEFDAPGNWTAPADCNRECILEVVGENSRIIGQEVAAVLEEQLSWMVRERAGRGDGVGPGNGLLADWELAFDGFSQSDMIGIEEYLVRFSGYENHRPTYTGARRTVYWYSSRITSARLNRNLIRMLDRLDIQARVSFTGEQNKIEITKVPLRRDRPSIDDDDW